MKNLKKSVFEYKYTNAVNYARRLKFIWRLFKRLILLFSFGQKSMQNDEYSLEMNTFAR